MNTHETAADAFQAQYGRVVGPNDVGRLFQNQGIPYYVTYVDPTTNTFGSASVHAAPARVSVDLGALAPLVTYTQGVLMGVLAFEVALVGFAVFMTLAFGVPS